VNTDQPSKGYLTRDQKKELLLAIIETPRDPASTPSEATPTEDRLSRWRLQPNPTKKKTSASQLLS
jgi:hypothetical protein